MRIYIDADSDRNSDNIETKMSIAGTGSETSSEILTTLLMATKSLIQALDIDPESVIDIFKEALKGEGTVEIREVQFVSPTQPPITEPT